MKQPRKANRLRQLSAVLGSTLPLAMAGTLLPTDIAQAAQASGKLEEVVVTAQKREQNLQDVGIAVTAFTGNTLREYGVTESFDIAEMTPGVHISGNIAGQNTQFAIRGVTQNDFNDIVEAPTAVYLDDGYIAIAQAQTFATYDIARVEILKGPQGTLFGRNATGGLVHYISNKPSFDKVDGYLDMTYGQFDSPAQSPDTEKVIGALGGPLTDKVAARAAFLWSKQGSYLKNKYPQSAVGLPPNPGAGSDLGRQRHKAGRLTFLIEPTDTLSVRLEGNVEHTNMGTAPYQSKPTIGVFQNVNGNPELVNVINMPANETRATIGPNGTDLGTDLNNNGLFGSQDAPGVEFFGRPVPGGDYFGYRDPDGKGLNFSSDFAFKNSNSTDTWGLNSRVDWELSDNVTLTSVTDYKDFQKLVFVDVDAAPVNQSANYAGVDANSFTQELRLGGTSGKLTWVAGLFYLHIDDHSKNGLKFPLNSVVPGSPYDLASVASLKTDSYSAFTQLQWDFTDQISLIGGARFIREDKNYNFFQAIYPTVNAEEINQGTAMVIGPVYDSNGAAHPFNDKTSDNLWAGVVRLEYKPTDQLLLYTAVKRGVKAGSFNAQLAGGLPVPTSAIPYKPEILYSYEVGLKSTFWDGRARFNANTFYYNYKDYQAFLFTGVSGVVVNADGTYYGAEGDFTITPLTGLDMRVAGSWLDATVKDVPLRVGGPISRNVQPNYAPKYQLSAMVRYQWPVLGGMMSARADYSWSDSFYYNLRNFSADKFDSYSMTNAEIAWTSPSEHWRTALQVRNLTNSKAGVQGFDLASFCGCNEISFRPPRWYGINVRYSL